MKTFDDYCYIQSLLNSAKECNCIMSNIFKNKVSLYRIYFCSDLRYKSKFCQNGSLPLYTLTLCDYKNFCCCKHTKSILLMFVSN